MGDGQVQAGAYVQGQGAHALVEDLLPHQHAPHIRVDDDRVRRAVGIFRAAEGAPLQALQGEGQAFLVGHLRHAQALHPHHQAGLIHHGEHRPHAVVGLAHQPAAGLLEVQHRRGRALDAHLVLQAAAVNRVALAAVRQHLGYDEQGDALGAVGCARQFRQHQVDDVVDQVVLAPGDPDLGTFQFVAAVIPGGGAGAYHAQVGAALGLRQAHRASPLPAHQLGQVGLLQLL